MIGRGLSGLVVLGAAACSNITTGDEGVATLVLFLPQPREIEAGQTIELRGEVLDADGNPLAVPVVWRALDTIVDVDSLRSLLTGRVAGRTGQVAARAGTLYSRPITFAVLTPVDTLVQVAPAVLTVAAGEDSSAELVVRLDGGTPPAPVSGRRVVYHVVEPAFPSAEDRTVELTGGSLLLGATTTTTGTQLPGVRLHRRAGRPAPDSAVVDVSAYRPGGEPIPGSGQRFVVRFLPP